MNFLSRLTTAAAAVTVAIAGLTPQAKADQLHADLANTLIRHGVSIQLNNHSCFDPHNKINGYYQGKNRLIVICNQHRQYVHQTDAPWTPGDLDTLRHEAQHFIQDCVLGSRHDHILGPLYKQPVKFALDILGRVRAEEIVKTYQSHGANKQVLVLELEAFAVAALNNPAEQINDINKYCRR